MASDLWGPDGEDLTVPAGLLAPSRPGQVATLARCPTCGSPGHARAFRHGPASAARLAANLAKAEALASAALPLLRGRGATLRKTAPKAGPNDPAALVALAAWGRLAGRPAAAVASTLLRGPEVAALGAVLAAVASANPEA